jgi:hypothetical protein
MVDNIPVGSYAAVPGAQEKIFSRGFPVGFVTPGGPKGSNGVAHNLNNHLRIIMKYHDDEDGMNDQLGEPTTKVVGFRVEPMSVKHEYNGDTFVAGQTTLTTCPVDGGSRAYQTVDRTSDGTVIFTYDVVWEKSAVEWSERWDVYLNSSAPNEKVSACATVAVTLCCRTGNPHNAAPKPGEPVNLSICHVLTAYVINILLMLPTKNATAGALVQYLEQLHDRAVPERDDRRHPAACPPQGELCSGGFSHCDSCGARPWLCPVETLCAEVFP